MNPILMTDIEKIRAEIERLQEIHERNLKKPMERGRIGYAHGVVACCDRILSFINSLPEEPDNEESNRPKSSDNLEEAARLYAIPHYTKDIDVHHIEEYSYDTGLEAAFIAGAKWQAEQEKDEWLKDREGCFWDGVEEGKRAMEKQMMKEAISCNVIWHDGPLLDYTQEQQDNALEKIGATIGDKVRIIIVKEDER